MEPRVFTALAFVIGSLVGSFLNVVIHRLPRGESVVSPGSRCPACGNAIRPWHNVPVLGWLWLRGKSACCKEPISIQYPLVEALCGVLGGAAFLLANYPWDWGGKPAERARFDAEGPAPRVGAYPANGFGLHDVAGNLYEWCAAAPAEPGGRRRACGGSWAERDPRRLEVVHRQDFPADYRGRAVGFRALRETKEKAK